MSLFNLFALDIAAIAILTFGVYFPRHRRKDMLLAFLGINIGVLAVTQALASTDVSAGLGLGLFGVLSIIRLRSTEMEQDEVAYYFAALALGLLGGFPVHPEWLTPVLMATIVATCFFADHPKLFGSYRRQVMTLDRAFSDETNAAKYLATQMPGRIHRVTIQKVDMVHDTTVVEVRYEQPDPASTSTISDTYRTAEFEVTK